MKTDYAYPTGDTLELDSVLYLRTDHLRIGRQGFVYVGNDITTERYYHAQEFEFCTEHCLHCVDILRWASGHMAVYTLQAVVFEDIECTTPKK